MDKRPCPCCGFLTLDQVDPGTYQICPVCYWEDDEVQLADPSYEGGANQVSLEAARQNYGSLGVSDARFKDKVRPPTSSETPAEPTPVPASPVRRPA